MASYDFTIQGDANPLPSPWESPSGTDPLQNESGFCKATADSFNNVMVHSSTVTRSIVSFPAGAAQGSPGAQYCCSLAGSDGYNAVCFTNQLQVALYRFDVELSVVSQATGDGGDIEGARDGDDVLALFDGVEIIRVEDTTYLTGRSGVFIGLTGYGVTLWSDGASAPTYQHFTGLPQRNRRHRKMRMAA